ncbi:hypothetical protein KFU94_01725 [Chloroflexi bacterium TSY]|nr:hypothetical protein [Chloroflexi bacterium TSY]
MNMPGFTAEASIYQSLRSYRGSLQTYSDDWSQIVPSWHGWFPWLGYYLFLSGTIGIDDLLPPSPQEICEALGGTVTVEVDGCKTTTRETCRYDATTGCYCESTYTQEGRC